jgi:dihydrodipicolinate synthase/N-acetylneuraminate lyase
MPRYKQTILGTCCVPWNDDGTLAESIFRKSIRGLITSGIPDLYIFGTAGEGYAVTENLFDRITKIFVEEMREAGSEPMVGAISLSLPTILDRIERAGKMGVRQFQISLPSWGALSDKELMTFFQEVCGRFPEFQFLHYNLPRTKRIVMPKEYAVLAAKHPNLVASKCAIGEVSMIAGLLQHAGEMRHFFTEQNFAAGSLLGECGFLISIASINPRRARQYFEAGAKRDGDTLRTMRAELMGLHAEMMGAVGSTPYIDGAYDKLFSRIAVNEFPLRLLPPYDYVSDAAFEKFWAAVQEKYPQWME